jgi:hypothetical protein
VTTSSYLVSWSLRKDLGLISSTIALFIPEFFIDIILLKSFLGVIEGGFAIVPITWFSACFEDGFAEVLEKITSLLF